jgi:hypothetical protein
MGYCLGAGQERTSHCNLRHWSRQRNHIVHIDRYDLSCNLDSLGEMGEMGITFNTSELVYA